MTEKEKMAAVCDNVDHAWSMLKKRVGFLGAAVISLAAMTKLIKQNDKPQTINHLYDNVCSFDDTRGLLPYEKNFVMGTTQEDTLKAKNLNCLLGSFSEDGKTISLLSYYQRLENRPDGFIEDDQIQVAQIIGPDGP